jgi:2-pyrone-4,6-dicarboxylate lactonase
LPLVFDHLGHVRTRNAIRAQAFQALLALVREQRAWVKLSGAYRVTGRTQTPYDDVRMLVDSLLAANPAQLIWGTDWPHPAIPIPVPDDTDLVDMFGDWISDDGLRKQILVENPQRLYGFSRA